MTPPDTDRGTRLVASIRAIPAGDGYGPWWASDDGVWLFETIRWRIGRPVVNYVHRTFGVEYDPLDVANTAVVALNGPRVRDRVCEATNPWAYLYVSLRRKMVGMAGPFFRAEIDVTDFAFSYEDPTGESKPKLLDAIQDTISCLLPLTPEPLHSGLIEGVYYFAERGHTRPSHLFTRATRDPALLRAGLNREQILAIANVVMGARPNRNASILAGYLQDPNWSPDDARRHRLAIEKYQYRMQRSLTPRPRSRSRRKNP